MVVVVVVALVVKVVGVGVGVVDGDPRRKATVAGRVHVHVRIESCRLEKLFPSGRRLHTRSYSPTLCSCCPCCL